MRGNVRIYFFSFFSSFFRTEKRQRKATVCKHSDVIRQLNLDLSNLYQLNGAKRLIYLELLVSKRRTCFKFNCSGRSCLPLLCQGFNAT